ncbi:MAG: release factor glutamine methyltransferase [Solirubrobacteraceae bacterium]|nr:release factor glutamine methyltransferase [Solirubrobacteraceae bacterium]
MIAQAVNVAREELAAAGCETPGLDAELLLGHALGVPRADLFLGPERRLDETERARFETFVSRRARREPVAYILGRRAFRFIELTVDERVLVPRPETELLVEVGLELARGARVLDLGTGSGAVALALKHERPDLRITGSDVSTEALAVARENSRRLGLEVELVECDLVDGLDGGWDAILSNPPYLADGERHALAREILDHEPPQALFAGGDGLDVIRRLLAGVPGRTALVALEVGQGQAARVADLVLAAGFPEVEFRRDLAGVERVVLGRR